MKKIASFAILALLILLAISCETSLEDEKQASNNIDIEKFLKSLGKDFTKKDGVYHAVNSKGFGYQVASGDSISFYYVAYTLDLNIFDTNIAEVANEVGMNPEGRTFSPVKTIARNGTLLEGVDRGILLCRENQLNTIIFPSTLGFGSNIAGAIPPWSPLAYDIYIIYVKNKEIEQEQNLISNFVANSQGFSRDTTGLWIKYTERTEQELVKPSQNDTVYGWYKEMQLNGQLLKELNTKGEQIALNGKELLEGIHYGFRLMKPGEKVNLVLPSYLAYGNRGSNSVEPYTPLLYELRLDSIKVIKNKSL